MKGSCERLKGRVALVTGAGQGIGRAVALRLSAEGAAIAAVDLQAETAQQTAAELSARGSRAFACQADVAEAEQVERAVRAAAEALGPIDVLVNVAGIYGTHALVREQTEENWDRVIGVNLTGGFLCSRAVVGGMMARGWGRIINVASGHALRGRPKVAPYTASKAAVIGFTKALALEVARTGVTVNAIVPAMTDTAMPRQNASEEEVQARGRDNPMGRMGQPEDLAAAIAFLASDDASYVTGQAVAINGGAIQLP